MKILITTPVWPPEIGGPATYTKELAQKLKNQHQITVAAFADKPEIIEGIHLTATSKRRPLFIRQIIYLKTILALGKKSDLIYTQNAMAAGVPSVIVSKLLGKPLILKFVGDSAWESAFRSGKTKKLLDDFLHKPDGGFKNNVRMLFQKLTLQNADKIVVPSDYLGRVLSSYYNIQPDKIITIYNAAESIPYNPDENITPAPNQIITVARLVPWKGVDGIIQATKILKEKITNIKLVIAGDGPEMPHLKQLVELFSIEKNVVFLGNISKKETANWRRASSVFVLNSLYEGLPHTVLSSFAVGIPVVATNISGTNEAVYNERTGLTVPPNNPQAIADAVVRLLFDQNLRSRLINNASQLLKEKFSWEAHLNLLNNLFESLISKPFN